MAEIATIKAKPRPETGSRAAQRERDRGMLPAIVYGHGKAPATISLDAHDMSLALSHGAHMLEISMEGGKNHFLIKDVHYDHLNHHPIHCDLMRVNLDELVRVEIGIELKGEPHGVSEGGVVEQFMSKIEVECRATDIPEILTPIVTHLNVGDSLFVKDLPLPSNVKALANPDDRVASVLVGRVVEELEQVAADGEEAQPELIGRGKKDQEQGAGEE